MGVSAFFCAASFLLAGACHHAPRVSGPLTHEAYVWQRVWSRPVVDAIALAGTTLAGFAPLAAEVSWKGRERVIVRPALDFDALKSSARPVGLVLRIGPYPGPFAADDDVATSLAQLARTLISDAREHGIAPVELQVDFDCAESKLAGYRAWLRAIREAVAPLPVCPTVLPSWLAQRDFAPLARDCGRFVLQVHAVAPPRLDGGELQLCDPARAAAWVETAGKTGVPFRVALPTYTYLAAFDARGTFLALSAEGPLPAWPRDAQLRTLRADATALSALSQRWVRDRPAPLTGIVWYRLPTAADTLNWRWPTLAAIVAGRTPRHSLRVETGDTPPSDITLINDGEIDEPIPPRIDAAWSGARLVAADALEGFELDRGTGSASFRATFDLALARLSPGERRTIGWLRLDPPERPRVSLHEN